MSAPLDNPKLLPLVAAVARRAQWRTAGQKVVMTNGVFDLLIHGPDPVDLDDAMVSSDAVGLIRTAS